jgi:hypothetical protein
MPSLAAAPDNPDTLPLVWAKAASINSLSVEVDHAAAKRLYERVGFCTDYTKLIAGQEYFHIADLSGPAAFTLPNAEARVTMVRCRL